MFVQSVLKRGPSPAIPRRGRMYPASLFRHHSTGSQSSRRQHTEMVSRTQGPSTATSPQIRASQQSPDIRKDSAQPHPDDTQLPDPPKSPPTPPPDRTTIVDHGHASRRVSNPSIVSRPTSTATKPQVYSKDTSRRQPIQYWTHTICAIPPHQPSHTGKKVPRGY